MAFTLDGRLGCVLLTSLPSDPNAPTQTELNAGTDLIGSEQNEQLNDIRGFEEQPSDVPVEGYASNVVGSIAGAQSFPQSALVFIKDDTVETIYSALSKGTTGWVAFMPDGQGTGEEARIFPITVASRIRSVARNAAHTYTVNVSISAPYEATQAA